MGSRSSPLIQKPARAGNWVSADMISEPSVGTGFHLRHRVASILRILTAKAESGGRAVIAVDPRHTSQRCAQCGHTAAGNRVTQAELRCLACGHHAHADVNAARNILRAGLALQEAHQAA